MNIYRCFIAFVESFSYPLTSVHGWWRSQLIKRCCFMRKILHRIFIVAVAAQFEDKHKTDMWKLFGCEKKRKEDLKRKLYRVIIKFVNWGCGWYKIVKIPKKRFEQFSWNFNEPMGVDKEVKVATVDVESGDNMATLPASSRSHHSVESAEKNATAIKEMEIKNVMPKPLERLTIILNIYCVLVCLSWIIESSWALYFVSLPFIL